MGLTIHYKVEFQGTARQLQTKLQQIKSACLDLPFEEVGQVKCVKITPDHIKIFKWLQGMLSYPNNGRDNLKMRDLIMDMLGVQTQQMIELGIWHDEGNRSWQEYEPTTIVSLALWPGEGCESCDLNFYKRGKVFVCHSFCKTQYATRFVDCHLLVIKLLDMLKEAGFKLNVNDEGNYWETRDLEVLAKNINDYTVLLGSVFGCLKQICRESGQKLSVESPIESCKNLVVVRKKVQQV
jgi:hypothetical protein